MTQYQKLDHPRITEVLFYPRRDDPAALDPSVPTLAVSVAEGVDIVCRLHLVEDPAAPSILFFHGNGETAGDYDDIAPAYLEKGINFLVADFRGYGLSGGSPSASAMMADAHRILQETKAYLAGEKRTGCLMIMGRSLGSACAIELCHAHPEDVGGLIIESGFAMTTALLQSLGVDTEQLGIGEPDGFQNVPKIAAIKMPTLILHAQYDRIIPLASAEILQMQSPAKSKEFQVIPGADHNTILEIAGFRYFVAIRRFIDKICKIRPKRYRRSGG